MSDRDFGECPLCSGSQTKMLFSIMTPFTEFQVVQCNVCKLARTFPRPVGESLSIHSFSAYHEEGVNKFMPIVQKMRNVFVRSRGLWAQSILNAMGWRKNELYEALKGNLMPGRGIHVVFQALLVALLLISGSLVSLLTSIREGPVLKVMVQRGN